MCASFDRTCSLSTLSARRSQMRLFIFLFAYTQYYVHSTRFNRYRKIYFTSFINVQITNIPVMAVIPRVYVPSENIPCICVLAKKLPICQSRFQLSLDRQINYCLQSIVYTLASCKFRLFFFFWSFFFAPSLFLFHLYKRIWPTFSFFLISHLYVHS